MPRFITFFSYSSESAKAMVERPTDRAAAVRALVESLGGTLESFYWMHGKHDGIVISNLPDGVAAAAVSVAVGSTGAITGLETHQIFDKDEQAAIVERAATARQAYRAPTG